jgi:putative endonuclease
LKRHHLKTKEIGDRGEQEAIHYLQEKGFLVLERNYRYRRYEVDIIARQESTLVFIEVKRRKNNRFGYPEEFIDEAKLDRIMEAAQAYCEDIDWNGDIRFDAIAISGKNSLEHFKDLS